MIAVHSQTRKFYIIEIVKRKHMHSLYLCLIIVHIHTVLKSQHAIFLYVTRPHKTSDLKCNKPVSYLFLPLVSVPALGPWCRWTT